MAFQDYANFINQLSPLLGGRFRPEDRGVLRLSRDAGVELLIFPNPTHAHLLLTATVGQLPEDADHEHAAALTAQAGRWFLEHGHTLCCPRQTRQVVLWRADALRPLQAQCYLDQICQEFAPTAKRWHDWLAGLSTGQAHLQKPPLPGPTDICSSRLDDEWRSLKRDLATDPDLGSVFCDESDQVRLQFIEDIEVGIAPHQDDFLLTCAVSDDTKLGLESSPGNLHWDLLHTNLWLAGPPCASWWWDASTEQVHVGVRHAAQYFRFEELRETLVELVSTVVDLQRPSDQSVQESLPLTPHMWV